MEEEEEGGRDLVDPKWPSHLPSTTSMESTGGAFQGRRVCPTTPIYISQRLVPDSGVRLQCTKLADGRGNCVLSGRRAAPDRTRPSKNQNPHYSQLPTILRVEMIWTAQ